MNAVVRRSAEDQLQDDIFSFYDDPYGYAMYVWPWGVKGTRLEKHPGPDKWQKAQMMRIRDAIRADPEGYQIREAVASGHGIGKGAQQAMITHWHMATRINPAGVTTANTMTQLRGKTWRELALWNSDAINSHWFDWTATKFSRKGFHETWFQDATPNSEHNSQSFAGLHGDYVLVVFDEASTIPNKIFEVTEGALTTPKTIFLTFGNPTEGSGAFYDVFHKFKKLWTTTHVDSRSARMATLQPSNLFRMQTWIDLFGIDSDFVKVRILGQFPSQSSSQFIPRQMVDDAQERTCEVYGGAIKVMGVDVARYGDDASVISRVHGRKLYPQKELRKFDTMHIADWVATEIRAYKPDVVYVDGIGIGAGVVDRLRQLGFQIFEVIGGAKPAQEFEGKLLNKRAECWWVMREWLKTADIPADDQELADQLTMVEYGHDRTRMLLKMQSKEEMKALGYDSPDRADSLSFCFAAPHAYIVDQGAYEPAPDPGY